MTLKIRSWAALTAVLYGVTISTLMLPVIIGAFWNPKRDAGPEIKDLLEIYGQWEYWLSIGILSILQLLILIAPLQVARHRPVTRGRWYTLAIVAGLMMGLLIAALVMALIFTIHLDKVPENILYYVGGAGIAAWTFWAALFARYTYTENSSSAINRVIDRLIAGSVAELLVAVPCHVYVRHKDTCCAQGGTFVGIATGLSVLLFAFGPGVFFLFVARVRRLKRTEEVDREDEDDRRLNWLGSHVLYTRRAVLWTVGAFIFLCFLFIMGIYARQNLEQLFKGGRASFVGMGLIACLYTFKAERRREPGWKVAAAGALILAEIIFVAMIWGWA